MPRHDDERNSTLQVWNLLFYQRGKPRFISQHSKSVISEHKANILNIQFMFCKEVFHKLKHIFCFARFFQLFIKEEVLLYGIIMDIPHQCNMLMT